MSEIEKALESLDEAARTCIDLSADQKGSLQQIQQRLDGLWANDWPELIRAKLEFARHAAIACGSPTSFESAHRDLSASIDSLQTMIDRLSRELPPLADDPFSENDAGESASSVETSSSNEGASSDETVFLLMDSSDDPLIEDFVGESMEHFQIAEEALLEIEGDPTCKESINAVFRAFHTVKGVAGLLNLSAIGSLAHRAESLLDAARNDRLVLEGQSSELCFKALDMLKVLLEALGDEGGPAPLPAAYAPLMDALRLAELGADPSAFLNAMKAADGDSGSSEATEVASSSDEDFVIEESEEPFFPNAEESAPSARVAKPQADPPPAEVHGKKKHQASSTVKVATERLDSLVDLVGELVIATAMIKQNRGSDQAIAEAEQRSLNHLCKVTDELQTMAMSMRMIPLRASFQKAARLVRDLGSKFNKKIHFEMDGEDTELDRNMVEKIGDPLVHMLRNSIDHGIETAEVRAQRGKDPVGRITLRASHQAGNVVIQLSDDGGGLKRSRIVAKAVESGLVSPEAGNEMSDQDVYQLIFQPGFSTAEKVTDVSGRGVGMDVVKKNIEALRGSAEIDSVEGQGTVFSMRLPLTLAIIDGMVVCVGNRRYILPTLSIENFLRPSPKQLFVVEGKGEAINVRGRVMPIHRLHHIFEIEGAIERLEDGLLVILELEGGSCALLVDDLIGQQQVVIKTLGARQQTPGVSGAAILGDGTVGLIVDPAGAIRISRESEFRAPTI